MIDQVLLLLENRDEQQQDMNQFNASMISHKNLQDQQIIEDSQQLDLNNSQNDLSQHQPQIDINPLEERMLPALQKKQNREDDPFNLDSSQFDQSSILRQQNQPQAKEEEKEEEITIPEEHQVKLDQFNSILPSKISLQLFSKKWTTRKSALLSLEEELQAPKELKTSDASLFYQVLMEVTAMTVNDKTTAVSLQSIIVTELFVSKYADKAITKSPDFNNQVDILLEVLLEKLGDNNLRIKNESEKTILAMAKSKNFETSQIVSHILRKYQLNKYNNSLKHTLAKLEILQKLITQYKIKNDDIPLTPVMNYTIQQIDHSNRDVRITALDLFFQIYSLVGEDRILPFFEQIKQNHLGIIKKEIQTLKDGGKGQTYKEHHKPQLKQTKQDKEPVDARMPQVGIKNRAKKGNKR